MKHKGIWMKLKVVFFMLMVISALILCWTAAYFIIHWLEWPHALLAKQLAVSITGFFIFGLLISIISRFGRRREMEFYQSIIDAFRKIARGDFNVSLPLEGFDNGRFTDIIKSINDMAADLNKLESMRQEFISNVSHEIQSPLTSINGFARVLKKKELTPEEREHYLDIIEQESVRLSRLSENMLRLASLDSEKHPFHPVPMRLDKQLQQLILACEPQWLDKDLDMSAELSPVTIDADPDLLSQVWVNLIHNAIKFTPHGGTIQVRLEAEGRQVCIMVEDSGIGISEEDQAHIFDRFYKADKSRTRSGGGSGLGLSIIQKIVQMHQGSVTATSQLGEGTTMTVRLPVAIAADRAPAQPAVPASVKTRRAFRTASKDKP
ncbi:HAMP domain-containing sensor histidine kinase [Paenibacillus dokdonensis]|uniref:histidine kinase n=1 Tax=Paenibacillus dokdonensis TaxID=2567944 RepID=A0ABU6GN00_9BACL|nr:HAMP domain-containing sensor histidine kinase [Paenibacillus dokdonensis]MEC0241119.1 HAMP domain-containing sensor histidine kinase [Paenibacillus dokdonensis]